MSRLWKLLALVFVVKCVTAVAIVYAGIGLMPDEAQYWTWSQALSYGYYSKPCGIAWQIAFGTHFFGDTEFGVRFGALILSFFSPIALYFLAYNTARSDRVAFWAAALFALSPLGIISGLLATTDCAYILFWTVACALFAKDLSLERPTSFAALALVIAIGAQWKWPIYAVWIPIMLFRPEKRALYGVALSLLGLIPSLVWNLEHDFSTFRHVGTSVQPTSVAAANPGSFVLAQFAILSPLLGVLLVLAWSAIVRSFKKALCAERFCVVTTGLFFGAVLAMSFFEKVQANWAVAAYPTAFALLGPYLERLRRGLLWAKLAGLVSILFVLIGFLLPRLPIPLAKNPWKEGLGWDQLAGALEESGYSPEQHFLFSDRYQMTSLLSFYGLEQKRAYFFNIKALRKNQFSYWPGMPEKELGRSGFFVEVVTNRDPEAATRDFQRELEPYFFTVRTMSPQVLMQLDGKAVKTAIILFCEQYNGKVPAETSKY